MVIIMNKRKYLLIYSILFIVLFFSCFGIYTLLYHKTLLRYADTYDMHYFEFLYLGRWVRTAIRELRFPVWDASIGYGADFFTTMSFFLLDPTNWIAIFIPQRFAEYGFALMVIFKIYLCGLSFSYLGFKRKLNSYAILCGAIIYSFGACTYTGLYQSGFFIPMYLFPLILCGVDDLFTNGKSKLYVSSLALMALGNFYLTYMSAILVILYCIMRWIFCKDIEKNIKTFWIIFKRIFIYSIWAAGIAAVALIPLAIVMLSMGRLNLDHFVPSFYSRDFYANLYKGFITNYDMLGRDCKIGFSVLALVCVFVLFQTKTLEKIQLKIEFILMSIGLCIPYVGHVMNGFGYIANRWIWAYALLLSYIVACMVPSLKNLSWRKMIILLVCSSLYLLIAYKVLDANGEFQFTVSIFLVLSCALCFLYMRMTEKIFRFFIVILSCISVIIPAHYSYSIKHWNGFWDYLESGTALSRSLNGGGLPLLRRLDKSDGTRYNNYGLRVDRNASWLYHVSGTDFYMNIYNDNIDNFHNSIAMLTYPWSYGYNNLDRRSELLALMGVNHFFVNESNPYHPVGFSILENETISEGIALQSWKPARDNSLFTRFKYGVSYDDFYKTQIYDRQQLLMKACIVDNPTTDTEITSIDFDDDEIEYTIDTERSDSGVIINGNEIITNAWNSNLVITIPEVKDAELYVLFDNLDFSNNLAMSTVVSAFGTNDGSDIPGMFNAFTYLTNIHHMYGGKKNWILNLGIPAVNVNGIRITFENPGKYSLDGLHFFARNTDSIRYNINRLDHDVYSVEFNDDQIILELDSPGKEYLFIAIPYSKGWNAYDNGKKISLLKADVGFMAIELNSGHHDIKLHYHTPGFSSGILITSISLTGYILLLLRDKKRNSLIIN